MFVIAPLAVFVAVFLALIGSGVGGRRSFLYAATWMGVATVGLTEGLGAAHLLGRPALIAGWAAILIAGCGGARSRIRAGVGRCRAWLACS